MIFSARQVQEKCREQGRDLCLAFIDITKAFDSVNREALWACHARLGCPPKCVNITRQLHEGMKGCVLGAYMTESNLDRSTSTLV